MQRWAAIAVLCLTAGRAAAAPRYQRPSPPSTSPVLAPAEAAWKAAADEPDPAAAAAKWKQAARGFDAVAADEGQPRALRSEAAYAAVLAWKNALAVDPRVKPAADLDAPADLDHPPPPQAIPADEQALLDALGHYLALSPAAEDVPGVMFLRANLLRRYHHDDEALAALTELLDHHRAHEVGEYAANLLLDLLIVHHRYPELVAWERTLRADAGFVRAHPELGERLLDIELRSLRLEAEAAEREARRTDDGTLYLGCAERYEALVGLAPTGRERDEVRYNAAVCREQAGDVDRALDGYAAIGPRSSTPALAAHALARRANLLARIGRYQDAIPRLEELAQRYPDEADAPAARLDAIFYRARLGDPAGAATMTRQYLKRYGTLRRAEAAEALAGLAALRLRVGDRKGAADDVRELLKSTVVGLDAERVGLLIWDAACPFARADRLCLRGDRSERDRRLAAVALTYLGRTHTGATALAEADAALESSLADAAADRAGLERAHAAYATLAAADWADPDSAALAHARLGLLAERALHPAEARAAYQACAAIARPSTLAVCDAGLARTGAAPVAAERAPTAAIAAPPYAAEPPIERDPSAPPPLAP